MLISVSNKTEYTPEWNDNLKTPDPIVVVHRVPTMGLRERLIPRPKLKLMVSADGKSEGGETEVEIDNKKIIQSMLVEIKNLAYTSEDGKEIRVKSADDLFGNTTPSALSGLADELGTYFQKILNERVDSKN